MWDVIDSRIPFYAKSRPFTFQIFTRPLKYYSVLIIIFTVTYFSQSLRNIYISVVIFITITVIVVHRSGI